MARMGARVGAALGLLLAALAAVAAAGPALAGPAGADEPVPLSEPVTVAVFDFELIDTSLEGELMGPRDDEARRLAALGEALRGAYGRAEGFAVVDLAPVREEAAGVVLHECDGCAADLAREAGAEMAVRGTVQKVSNLILNINLYVSGPDGAERAFTTDIRGNTDEAWRRGLDWLIRHRLGIAG